jgi:predicted nucleic acid-binding Zn ribbon protein
MASYKQPCIHCGAYIEPDARFCTSCRSQSPFGHLCPACLRPIEKEQPLCSGCGRVLYIPCPACGKQTFVQEKCEQCGAALMVLCQNPRCGARQFFQNTKCTACGKKIKSDRR